LASQHQLGQDELWQYAARYVVQLVLDQDPLL